MQYNNLELHTDKNGKPLPQYYDPVSQSMVLATKEIIVASITAGDTNIGNVDIASALPVGTNLIGKVGVDQTTDGTTNRVVAKISQTAGENLVQLSGSIRAEDPATGNPVNVTAAQDGSGKWVLRTVDAAPFAYDPTTQTIKTKQHKPAGNGLIKVFSRSGALAASSTEVVMDIPLGKAVEIQRIEFSCNTDSIFPSLSVQIYNAASALEAVYLTVPLNGTALLPVNPSRINANKSSLFQIDAFGASGSKISLARPVIWTNGGRISVTNSDSGNIYNVACAIVIREIDI